MLYLTCKRESKYFDFQGSSDICSIRLVFDLFSMAGPVTSTVSETSGVSRTQCQEAQFSVNTDGDIYSQSFSFPLI